MVINDSIQRSVKAVIHQYHLGTDKAVQAGTAAASGEQSAEPAVQTRPRRVANQDKQDILSWNALLEQKSRRPSAYFYRRNQ